MLSQDSVFQYGDLGAFCLLTDHHDPVDTFAPRQELGLSQDWCPTASGLAAFATALLLGL